MNYECLSVAGAWTGSYVNCDINETKSPIDTIYKGWLWIELCHTQTDGLKKLSIDAIPSKKM